MKTELVPFDCSECGHKIKGPDCAISMTVDCPSCGTTATAYKVKEGGDQ